MSDMLRYDFLPPFSLIINILLVRMQFFIAEQWLVEVEEGDAALTQPRIQQGLVFVTILDLETVHSPLMLTRDALG